LAKFNFSEPFFLDKFFGPGKILVPSVFHGSLSLLFFYIWIFLVFTFSFFSLKAHPNFYERFFSKYFFNFSCLIFKCFFFLKEANSFRTASFPGSFRARGFSSLGKFLKNFSFFSFFPFKNISRGVGTFKDFRDSLDSLNFSFLRVLFPRSAFLKDSFKFTLFKFLHIFLDRKLFRTSIFWFVWKQSQLFRYFFKFLLGLSFLRRIKFIFFLKNIALPLEASDKRDFFFLTFLWFFFLCHFRKLFLTFKFKINCFLMNSFFFKKHVVFYSSHFFHKLFFNFNANFWGSAVLYSLGKEYFLAKVFKPHVGGSIYKFLEKNIFFFPFGFFFFIKKLWGVVSISRFSLKQELQEQEEHVKAFRKFSQGQDFFRKKLFKEKSRGFFSLRRSPGVGKLPFFMSLFFFKRVFFFRRKLFFFLRHFFQMRFFSFFRLFRRFFFKFFLKAKVANFSHWFFFFSFYRNFNYQPFSSFRFPLLALKNRLFFPCLSYFNLSAFLKNKFFFLKFFLRRSFFSFFRQMFLKRSALFNLFSPPGKPGLLFSSSSVVLLIPEMFAFLLKFFQRKRIFRGSLKQMMVLHDSPKLVAEPLNRLFFLYILLRKFLKVYWRLKFNFYISKFLWKTNDKIFKLAFFLKTNIAKIIVRKSATNYIVTVTDLFGKPSMGVRPILLS